MPVRKRKRQSNPKRAAAAATAVAGQPSTEQILSKIYYNPKGDGSFSGAANLWRVARAELPKLTLNEVKKWLASQITYTLHKQARKKWARNRVYVDSIDEQWQADLTFVEKYHKENNGYKYILTMIDILSKYAFAKPLKSKTPQEVKSCLEEIFKIRKPQKLQTDKGGEFDNRIIRKFFDDHEVQYFTTNSPEIKCSVVERFNRTLKNKIFKFFTANGTRKWAVNLDEILQGYNNTVHRAIKMKPSEVTIHNHKKAHKNLYGESGKIPGKAKFVPGDTVRIQHKRGLMDRGFYPYWTDATYEVEKVLKESKNTYRIKGGDPKRKYYPEELQKISGNTYRVEKVIRKKGTGKNQKYLVKWLGYDSTHNSWIPARDLISMTTAQAV